MKIKFWLLDIAYTIEKGKPQVELWGIDEKGNRILIIDNVFRPYFYAIPREDADTNMLIQQIKKLSNPKSPILKIEKVERRFFGKPLIALRLMCQNPKDVPGYRDAVIKIRDIDSYLEADIRYSIRYLIDNQLIPCTPYRAIIKPYDFIGTTYLSFGRIRGSRCLKVRVKYLTSTKKVRDCIVYYPEKIHNTEEIQLNKIYNTLIFSFLDVNRL